MNNVQQWQVPGRVTLVGEHLDYNGGPTLTMAIDRFLTLKGRPRRDNQINVWTDLDGGRKTSFTTAVRPGEVHGWAAHPAGVIWSLVTAGHRVGGCDLVIESHIEAGAGLGSSAALGCAVLQAFNEFGTLGLEPTEITRLAQRAENEFVGAPTGILDQTAVTFAQPGEALLIDSSTTPPTLVSLPIHWTEEGLMLAVISTGVQHQLADGEYAARHRECATAASRLGLDFLAQAGPDAVLKLDDPILKARVRHVITETARVRGAERALKARDWNQFGAIMTASHASLRDDFEVSCPELDTVVDSALEADALGARMVGAGFGGSAIALVPIAKAAAMRDLINSRFEARDWPLPRFFSAKPAGTS